MNDCFNHLICSLLSSSASPANSQGQGILSELHSFEEIFSADVNKCFMHLNALLFMFMFSLCVCSVSSNE